MRFLSAESSFIFFDVLVKVGNIKINFFDLLLSEQREFLPPTSTLSYPNRSGQGVGPLPSGRGQDVHRENPAGRERGGVF